MIFQPKEITLKNGKTAILKTPEISDAAKMLAYITKACGETEFLIRYPEEWEGVTVETEEKWVENCRESKNTLAISCFIDGEIAGNCEITFRGGIKTSHRAIIGIAILQKYWNLGIGTAMFREMIALARAWGAEQLELEYIEGNERGVRLYDKMGFRTVAERPRAIRLKDGTYLSEFIMIKDL